MIDAKVTGYWGAGIPIDKGRVGANPRYVDVTIKWDDGREVMHLEHNIRDGAWHNHDTKKYGLSAIWRYWGAHLY